MECLAIEGLPVQPSCMLTRMTWGGTEKFCRMISKRLAIKHSRIADVPLDLHSCMIMMVQTKDRQFFRGQDDGKNHG